MVFPYTQRTWVCEKINPESVGNYRSMKIPRGKQRGIFGNYFLFAASGGELNP
jgi:hypothetical protein